MTKPAPAAERASGSSFYTAMRILPRAQRKAVFEIYAFCRAVDDIADDPGPRELRRAQLQRWRSNIEAIYRKSPPPSLAGLAQAVREFDLSCEDFMAIIAGVEMDVETDLCAPDCATLELYCDRVACAVGRLCVRVFGMQREAGLALAGHLGRALQLTNVLRDLDEDAEVGRLYLPRETLQEVGITASEPAVVLAHHAIDEACASIVELAKIHFREAEAIMTKSPRRLLRAPRIMGEAYQLLLKRLVARGFAPPRRRVRLPRLRLLLIVLRNLV